MAFSLNNILAIATCSDVELYNVNTHSFTHTLPLGEMPTALAFSPDCTHLAVGDQGGNVSLWDIRGIGASSRPSTENATAVTALALSRDCSQLVCGFVDGTVELWGTSPTKRRIGPLALRSKLEAIFFRIFRQSRHTRSVRALGFDPDSRLFASGSDDGTIKLWNGGDGVLRGSLKTPGKYVEVQTIALSTSVLVASLGKQTSNKYFGGVTLFDMVNHTTISAFNVPFDIHTMTFLPDNSQLVVQSDKGVFQSFNILNNCTTTGPTLEHLVQLPNAPLGHGVPVWHCKDKNQHYVAALFSQHTSPVPVVWIPRQVPVTTWARDHR